jgi:hypothetical protein
MDVLAYSAFNQQITVNQQIAAKTSCLATKCSETAAKQASAANLNDNAICWLRCIEPCLLRTPFAAYSCNFACCIPELTGATGGFKVCRSANSTFFNYGACCQWTVPAGASSVRFQIWGAGGNSGAGCCCGGSPFGATGAYASVIMPVTPGDVYTLCAGCSSCCRPDSFTNADPRWPGCPSFVTGNGLSNFCANGGPGKLGNWMAALGRLNTCRLQNLGWNYCGGYFCNNGSDYCGPGCFCTLGPIDHVPASSYFGTTTNPNSPGIVYGIRGMWPCVCLYNYGGITNTHPPVYGFSTLSCCSYYNNSTCCGRQRAACSGFLQVPSAGGSPTIVTSGSNSVIGDYGRGGMVCVTFR